MDENSKILETEQHAPVLHRNLTSAELLNIFVT